MDYAIISSDGGRLGLVAHADFKSGSAAAILSWVCSIRMYSRQSKELVLNYFTKGSKKVTST